MRRIGLASARTLWVSAAVLALAGTLLRAEPLTSIPNPRTRDGTWVTDTSGALRPDTVARLNSKIGEIERTTGVELAVVVIRSLDGLAVEEAAVTLFESWGIGKKHADNGLLFLWSTGDRRVRVEVGYGLEGALPDGKVGAILDTYVIPRFKAGEFDEGVLAGVEALLAVARNEPIALRSQKSESYETRSWGVAGWLLGLLGGIPLTIASIVGLRRWRRYRRRRCPRCGARMVRLSEAADDALLDKGQQAEERIGSVDYDVWKCPDCSYQLTLRYPRWSSTYDECPQCHNRTKASVESVVEPATIHGSGMAEIVETCGFCTYENKHTKVLPQLQSPASSSSDSNSSWSSSSSSNSSSFGGGSSGGGGASRGY